MNSLRSVLLVGLFGLSACFPSMNEAGTDASNSQCTIVAIEDLYAMPADFDGKHVCTRGYLAAAYQDVSVLPTMLSITNPPDARLITDISFVRTIEMGLETGDLVRAEGHIQIDQECFDLYNDPERTQDWSCLPIVLPVFLNDAVLDAVD